MDFEVIYETKNMPVFNIIIFQLCHAKRIVSPSLPPSELFCGQDEEACETWAMVHCI